MAQEERRLGVGERLHRAWSVLGYKIHLVLHLLGALLFLGSMVFICLPLSGDFKLYGAIGAAVGFIMFMLPCCFYDTKEVWGCSGCRPSESDTTSAPVSGCQNYPVVSVSDGIHQPRVPPGMHGADNMAFEPPPAYIEAVQDRGLSNQPVLTITPPGSQQVTGQGLIGGPAVYYAARGRETPLSPIGLPSYEEATKDTRSAT